MRLLMTAPRSAASFGAVAALGLVAAIPALAGDTPLGLWARGDGQAQVRITTCGDAFCATNTWIKDPKSEEKVGDKLIMRVKPAGESTYSGTAFDPQRNKSVKMEIKVASTTMTSSGCILGGLACKTVKWSRLD